MQQAEQQEGPSQDPALLQAQMTMQLKQQESQQKRQLEQKLAQARELELYRIAAANDMKLTELEQKLGIEQERIQSQRDIAPSTAH